MIDKYDKGTLDIFDPENWHPANRPARKKEEPQKEKPVHEMSREEQLVNLKSFVAFNKLDKQVEEYRIKAKAINDKNKKT